MANIPPGYVALREPSFDPTRPGRLLAFYHPARRLLRIKRNDGPEITFDLDEVSETHATDGAHDAQSVV